MGFLHPGGNQILRASEGCCLCSLEKPLLSPDVARAHAALHSCSSASFPRSLRLWGRIEGRGAQDILGSGPVLMAKVLSWGQH